MDGKSVVLDPFFHLTPQCKKRRKGSMHGQVIVPGFILLLSLICNAAFARPLSVTFLDVGEGEAIVVQSGPQTGLIDAGNLITGHRVLTFLLERGVKHLDWVLITHPHSDHLSGIFQLLPTMEIRQRYDNGQSQPESDDIFRWYREQYRIGNYRVGRKGDQIQLGDAQLTVLNAQQTGRVNMNQNSLVLKLSHGKVKMLFMADAGVEVEKSLIEQGVDLSAHVLKIGHHGASDATSAELLDAVNPDYAIISINNDNLRAYPSSDVVNRVRQRNISLLMTFHEGDISFESNGEQVSRIE